MTVMDHVKTLFSLLNGENEKSASKSSNNKTMQFSIAAVFISFALMQYNDPDPLRWILMYGLVAVVCINAGLEVKISQNIIKLGLVACTVWCLVLLPEFYAWIQMGMPTITGSMKAEEPHIEYTREFLGLVLCCVVLGMHLHPQEHNEPPKKVDMRSSQEQHKVDSAC
jgi:hypothetical protein